MHYLSNLIYYLDMSTTDAELNINILNIAYAL